MRHFWIIGLLTLLYNGLVIAGMWMWDWSLGITYPLLLLEVVLLAACVGAELVQIGSDRPRRAWASALISFGIAVVGAVLVGGLATYYVWFTGIHFDAAIVAMLVALLFLRYAIETWIRLIQAVPRLASSALHRTWFRIGVLLLLVAISGLPFIVFEMSQLPFDLPAPGAEFFHVERYLAGLPPRVPHLVAASTLTLLFVVKLGLDVAGLWGRDDSSRGRFGFADRFLDS